MLRHKTRIDLKRKKSKNSGTNLQTMENNTLWCFRAAYKNRCLEAETWLVPGYLDKSAFWITATSWIIGISSGFTRKHAGIKKNVDLDLSSLVDIWRLNCVSKKIGYIYIYMSFQPAREFHFYHPQRRLFLALSSSAGRLCQSPEHTWVIWRI